MLCSIFAQAIRDEFYTARDMMLMSHLQACLTLQSLTGPHLITACLGGLDLGLYSLHVLGSA